MRGQPGHQPLQQKGLTARLLLPAKGSQTRVPPATTGASLQLRGLGLLYLQKPLHAEQEICTPQLCSSLQPYSTPMREGTYGYL